MRKFLLLIAVVAVVLGLTAPVSAHHFRSNAVVVNQPAFCVQSAVVVQPAFAFPAVSYQLAVPFVPTVTVFSRGSILVT
jgi:hypothetical protein